MKISLDLNDAISGPVGLTIGVFDGIHKGHSELISTLVAHCRSNGLKSIVLTFINHPQTVLRQNYPHCILMSNDHKVKMLKQLGVDHTFLLNFDEEFAMLQPNDFIDKLLNLFKINYLIIGHDFRYGNKGMGDANALKAFERNENFTLKVMSPFKINDIIVSSSKIRELLTEGNLSLANLLLGYNYELPGKVIKGVGRGAGMGFPTANLSVDSQICIPGPGVYLTKGIIDNKEYWGATSIGSNPTFSQGGLHIETFFLDLDINLYNKVIGISFIEKIRDQITFVNVSDLIAQIDKDVRFVKNKVCNKH